MQENQTIIDDYITEESKPEKLTDTEIFTKIWFSPRKVFSYIHAYSYDKYVIPLLIIGGIISSLDRSSTKNLGDTMSTVQVIVIAVIVGGLLGWLSYYIFSALISVSGKWINGKANTKKIVRVIAYTIIPSLVSLPLLIIQMIAYGDGLFRSDFAVTTFLGQLVAYVTGGLAFILAIWSIVFAVVAISVVQEFSIGKAILNLFLAFLLILVPIFLIALIFFL